jgi:AraC-like DNA-binding protein
LCLERTSDYAWSELTLDENLIFCLNRSAGTYNGNSRRICLRLMATTDYKSLRFSLDDVPGHRRIEEICEIYGRTIIKHDIEPIGDGPFHFDADLHSVAGLGLASVAIAPCRAPRRTEHIDNDDLVFNVSLSGGRTVQQRGREALVVEGEAVLMTGADPGIVTIPRASRLISLRIPQRTLRPALVDFDASLLRPIRRAIPALRLLTSYVDAIRAAGALAPPELRAAVVAHIHDLVVLVLGAADDARQAAEKRGLRAARQTAVLRAIAERSGDPGLTAAAIAAELSVTPRYVHLLLEETGKSFTHHLLEKRLERAGALLRDPRWRERRIADVAFAAGFTDLSYFNRTFRRRYGTSPSDARETERHE